MADTGAHLRGAAYCTVRSHLDDSRDVCSLNALGRGRGLRFRVWRAETSSDQVAGASHAMPDCDREAWWGVHEALHR